MKQLVTLQEKIVPELIQVLERRYNILRSIYFSQPIGRRILAAMLGLGERLTRSDVELLKAQGLVSTDPAGMWVTREGERILWELEEFMHLARGLSVLEEELARKLKIRKVLIVAGDSSTDETVKKEMGRVAATYLKQILRPHQVLAITGGTSTLEVAQNMPQNSGQEDILVVPARGGLGEEVEIQANVIAAKLAQKLGGAYRLLHVPDNLSKEALEVLSNDPGIQEVLSQIQKANIVIHGIGSVEEMARRRGLTPSQVADLQAKGAKGEAMASYFNSAGQEVEAASSLGLPVHDLKLVSTVLAVAGGSKKAEAIKAVVSNQAQQVLVTDEGAAELINKLRY